MDILRFHPFGTTALASLGVACSLLAGCITPQGAKAQATPGPLTAEFRVDRMVRPGGPLIIEVKQDVWDEKSHTVDIKQYPILPPGQWTTIALGLPADERDSIITLTVAGATQLVAGLSCNGVAAEENSYGSAVSFFLRHRGGQYRFQGAEELYRDDLELAQAAAVPGARRPRRFIVADYLVGPGPDPEALEDGLETFEALGTNTLQISDFGELSPGIADRARAHGIDRFSWALAYPPSLFSWSHEAENPSGWAQDKIAEMTAAGIPPQSVALFKIAEEPTWHYPGVMNPVWTDPVLLGRFRDYLRAHNLTPPDLGGNSWNDISPQTASLATTLPLRRRFYWTLRFFGDGAAQGMGVWSAALRNGLNPNVLFTANNYPSDSRGYFPGDQSGRDPNPDDGMQWPYWMDIGRLAAPFGLWTEDWTPDADAETWSFHADILRCAARQTPGNTFGGNVVGRTIGSVSGAKLRAFALLGHGAKALLWYNHGPEPYFQKFSWGDNEAAYPAIAQTNALIGSAENVLYPGQAGNAKIALFLPRSAYFWGARDTDPYWGKDLKGIYYALTHAHYPVDFVDEDGIASGELTTRGYKLLYVTAPNLPGPAAAALHDWVRTGGTAVFSDIYAGGADEYDETSHALDDLRGVAPTPRAGAGDSPITGPLPVVHGPVVFVNPTYGTGSVRGEVAPEPLPVTTAQVLANYGGGGAAIARQTYGAGQTFTYGFRLGSSYLLTGKETPGGLPQGWDAEWRSMAVEPAYIVARDKPVDVDVDLVEAVRLESAAGIAVTLLNWTGQPLDHVTVTVHHAGNVNSARLADGGTVPVTRNGDDVTVTLPLRDVNVLMLRP